MQSRSSRNWNLGNKLVTPKRVACKVRRSTSAMSEEEDTMMIDADDDIVPASKNKGKGKMAEAAESDDNLPWYTGIPPSQTKDDLTTCVQGWRSIDPSRWMKSYPITTSSQQVRRFRISLANVAQSIDSSNGKSCRISCSTDPQERARLQRSSPLHVKYTERTTNK
jgi:hypothetical protein